MINLSYHSCQFLILHFLSCLTSKSWLVNNLSWSSTLYFSWVPSSFTRFATSFWSHFIFLLWILFTVFYNAISYQSAIPILNPNWKKKLSSNLTKYSFSLKSSQLNQSLGMGLRHQCFFKGYSLHTSLKPLGSDHQRYKEIDLNGWDTVKLICKRCLSGD